MGIVELFFIAVGLSMDAFAVAICKGLCLQKMSLRRAALVGLFFGGFQGMMPLLGWILGSQFERYIVKVDHWIAFLLLGYLGGKMIWDAFHDEDECEACGVDPFSIKELFVMAVATSIDALAVGITFAFLRTPIVPAVTFIGVITFTLSMVGVWIGHKFGSRFKNKATFAGGLILCCIGLKILLEHLGFLG